MALSQSALAELLDALHAGGDLDVVREALGLVLQALLDAEATQHLGARPYKRTRAAHRAPQRHPRPAAVDQAGDVELRIPKLGEGSFFPALLEPRRRIDRALLAVVMEGGCRSWPSSRVKTRPVSVHAGPQASRSSTCCSRWALSASAV